MSDLKDNSSDIDLSEDLNIDDLLNDLQPGEQETQTNEDINIDDNTNFDSNDLDKNDLEIDDSSLNNEIEELDGDLNIDDEVELKDDLKLEDTNDLDLDSEIELGDIDNIENRNENLEEVNLEDINIDSNKESNINDEELNINIEDDSNLKLDADISSDINFDSIDEVDIDNLDLKSDLGLNDKLSISKEENVNYNENSGDFDLSDDEGNPIGESEEEYGVDIKSEPETISSFEIDNENIGEKIFPEENEENLRSIVDDIEKEIEIDQIKDYKEYNDQNKDMEHDIDLTDYSDKNIPDETSEDQNIQIDNLDTDLNVISSDLDEEIEKDIDNEELPVISSEDLDIDITELSDNDFIEETSESENKKEDELNIDSFDIDSISDEIETLNSKNNIKEDISPEELDINLSEEEINSSNLDNEEQKEEEFDLSEINIPSSFESEITDESSVENESSDTGDAIDLKESELTDLEKDILPEDQSIPGLDEEISDIELTEIEGLTDNISSPSDAATVISDEIKDDLGGLDKIDLDNIPQPTGIEEENKENESISLSIDELDIVTADAKIKDNNIPLTDENKEFENEIETFDFDSLDEDLKSLESEIKIDNKGEDAYKDLKQEMIEKTDTSKIYDVDSLRQNVKDVLMYLDQLLDALPEEKIKEFAESKTFEKYKRLFKDLNIKT